MIIAWKHVAVLMSLKLWYSCMDFVWMKCILVSNMNMNMIMRDWASLCILNCTNTANEGPMALLEAQ